MGILGRIAAALATSVVRPRSSLPVFLPDERRRTNRIQRNFSLIRGDLSRGGTLSRVNKGAEMRGSVVLAGAILGAVSLVGVSAPAGAAASDPYSGAIETQCSIDVPAVVEPGDRVVVRVSVDANSPTPPKGQVTVTITERPSGEFVWDKTVNYNGGTKRIVGPALSKDTYTATARFVPSDDTFKGCRASEAFAVDSIDDGGPDDNGDDGPGGLLPDTGGPALLWLLLGVGLVGGGTATVVYARRRTSPATA